MIKKEFMRYAGYLVARGYISSQLGNIAVRSPENLVYTKHKGISLEEIGEDNIIVTDINGRLVEGCIPPSIGHCLNIAVLQHRADVNAVIHVHSDEAISFFMATNARKLKYISVDVPIVLGRDVKILDPEINVEKDAHLIEDFIMDTNVFIMPNHGITTVGESLSIAYNRVNAVIAELKRIRVGLTMATLLGSPLRYISDLEKENLYRMAGEIL